MNDLACIYCGCTEERACPGGCAWATEIPDRLLFRELGDVCTACTDIAEALGEVLRKIKVAPGFKALHFLCIDPRGPRLVLDRWLRFNRPIVGQLAAPPRREGRRKTPRPAAPANPRKPSFPVSHKDPRGKSRVKRHPGGRR